MIAVSTSGPLARQIAVRERERRQQEAERRAAEEAERRRRCDEDHRRRKDERRQALEALDQLAPGKRPQATCGDMMVLVSAVTGVSVKEISGRGRQRPVAFARQVVAWLAYRRLGLSYPQVGRRLRRDHTTALHAVRRIDAIAARRGVTTDTPAREAVAVFWRHRSEDGWRRGVDNSQHRLNDDAVREIRRLRGQVSQRALARRYGVSVGTVFNVQLGRSWKHVQP